MSTACQQCADGNAGDGIIKTARPFVAPDRRVRSYAGLGEPSTTAKSDP